MAMAFISTVSTPFRSSGSWRIRTQKRMGIRRRQRRTIARRSCTRGQAWLREGAYQGEALSAPLGLFPLPGTGPVLVVEVSAGSRPVAVREGGDGVQSPHRLAQ